MTFPKWVCKSSSSHFEAYNQLPATVTLEMTLAVFPPKQGLNVLPIQVQNYLHPSAGCWGVFKLAPTTREIYMTSCLFYLKKN